MYEIKKRIYTNFDKTQKTALCNFLRATVKQNINKTVQDILNKFLENEKYYLQTNTSRFPFLNEYINQDKFLDDTKLYLKECKKYYEYKESQRPFIEKQKKIEKEKRQYLQQIKMSKETPTKKQLYYYDKLCQKYNIEKLDTNNLSKLDLKNEIGKILDEYSTNSSHISE